MFFKPKQFTIPLRPNDVPKTITTIKLTKKEPTFVQEDVDWVPDDDSLPDFGGCDSDSDYEPPVKLEVPILETFKEESPKQRKKPPLPDLYENEPKWECWICPEICDKRYYMCELNSHLYSKHANKNVYVCEICSEGFPNRDGIVAHNLNHPCPRALPSTKPITCKLCAYKCFGFRNLQVHCMIQHQGKVTVSVSARFLSFSCEICHEIIYSLPNFAKHQEKMHGITPTNFEAIYESTYDSYWDKKQALLPVAAIAPLTEDLGNQPKLEELNEFVCKQCNRSFKWSKALSKHVRRVHTDTFDFKCKRCGITFDTFQDHCDHKTKCDGKRVSCPQAGCRSILAHKRSLCNHLRQKHGLSKGPKTTRQNEEVIVNGQKRYKCDLCEKTYPKNWKVNVHRNCDHRDTGVAKLYVCKFEGCDYQSNWNSNLYEHTKLHGEKKNVCDVCGWAFYTSQSLSRHKIKRHTINEIVCPICGKVFTNKITLSKHISGHTSSYQCHICQKKFNWRTSVKTHMEFVHSDVRNFICKALGCAKAFKSKGHLKRHAKERGHPFFETGEEDDEIEAKYMDVE